MNPHWFAVADAAFTLFVIVLILAGAVAWVIDAIGHHRARCNRILNPPRRMIRRA